MDALTYRRRNSIRWRNWRDFTEAGVEQARQSDTACLVVTFNASHLVERLLRRINTSQTVCDIVIIDNGSDVTHAERLRALCVGGIRPSVVRSRLNLGSGGGYALGVEWCLAKGYDFVFVTEDDVMPVGEHTLADIVARKDAACIADWYYQNNGTTAFFLHGRLYPRRLLEAAGGPDPDYFMRSDDQEWAYRVKAAQLALGIVNVHCRDLAYIHPILKKSRDVWTTYFGVRNSLHTEARHGSLATWIREVFKRLPCGFSIGLSGHGWQMLTAAACGIADFSLRRNSIALNARRFTRFRSVRLALPADAREIWLTAEEWKSSAPRPIVGAALAKALGATPSPLLAALFGKPTPIGASLFNVLHPFWLLRDRMTFIEEINLESGRVAVTEWRNGSRTGLALTLASFGLAFVAGAVLMLLALPRFLFISLSNRGS